MKLSTIKTYLLMFWVFLLPVQNIILATLALVMIDFITGITASIKEGHPITSRSAFRTISKLCVYEIVIIVGFGLELYLLEFPITKTIGGLIGVIEGKSFFENLYRITKVDLLRIIIDKLHLKYQHNMPKVKKSPKILKIDQKPQHKRKHRKGCPK